jgi:hypothetical protein
VSLESFISEKQNPILQILPDAANNRNTKARKKILGKRGATLSCFAGCGFGKDQKYFLKKEKGYK